MNKTPTLRSELRRILDDGEWHHFDELFAECRHLVTPECAYRWCMHNRRNGSPPDLDAAIRSGTRRAVSHMLGTLIYNGKAEAKGRLPERSYRKCNGIDKAKASSGKKQREVPDGKRG